MNWQGCGRKRLGPYFKYDSGDCLEGLVKTTKIQSQASPLLQPGFRDHIVTLTDQDASSGWGSATRHTGNKLLSVAQFE
jgi:hypothetical protein